MLAIRMQRTGRKGHAMFRVIVQDSRRTPTSGNVVALLGSYDPHAKTISLDKERAGFYLEHGAQPSTRAAKLLETEGVVLPSWVKISPHTQRDVRNAEKRRSTAPTVVEEKVVEEKVEEAAPAEAIAEAEPDVTTDEPDTSTDTAEEAAADSEETSDEADSDADEPEAKAA
jgi:small subunit ribosomal protein S16